MNERAIRARTLPLLYCIGFVMTCPSYAVESAQLQDVINTAITLDPLLKQSEYKQIGLEQEATSKLYWPDPRVSLAVANLPVESFDLDQEPMTQIVLGVTQMLPRGKSLKLRREQIAELAKVEAPIRQQRIAATKRDITILWLQALREQEKAKIVEQNRIFFEQMSELASANYISTRGKTRQQHLIRTELEIMKLDEKLQRFAQNRDQHISKLNTWLLSGDDMRPSVNIKLIDDPQLQSNVDNDGLNAEQILRLVALHPEVRSIEQTMFSAEKKIALSREVGKAAWGISAKYGYREGEREDFVSLGVSVDVPINQKSRNRKMVSSATQQHAAIKEKRRAVTRKLQSQFLEYRSQIRHLEKREAQYRESILTQMRVEAEAAQNAYISDEGDFQDVIRALIGELGAQLDVLEIDIQRQMYITKIEYLLTGKAS